MSGAIGQEGVFYIGLPNGGVWKTTGGGVTWVPVFDSIKEASSVGSIEVAPSNPSVIYVGMGDMVTGGGINEGNGVYKSTDAGKTWVHLGLDETKQIPSIFVDPKNPDLVLIAAQGNLHTINDDRGVYRSTDGGTTWKKTLFLDTQTGIQKLAAAYDHPTTILATSTRHYSSPGAARGAAPTGTAKGTALFRSLDEGLTWKELSGNGLPSLSGRTCVAVANHTDGKRMFLVSNSGLYRSDDAGDHWKRMDPSDRRVMNGQGGYNCGVYVDSQNPDIVYVINTCSYRSLDGGNTFTGFKGAPGGDDPQQMWIDPTNPRRMLLGTDQGATVSYDAGDTWSSWYNQATAQCYHISVDNSFPYWVYGVQQDSGTIATRSRGDLGEITPLDWLPTPAYEFGSAVADPLNPKIVYAGSEGGGIEKISYPSGQWINVSPNIEGGSGLRKVGNQPLVWSSKNPHELLAGFNFLMSTTDGGVHWKKLGPDLGYGKGVKLPTDSTPSKPAPVKKPVPKPVAIVEEEGEVMISEEEQEMRLLEEGEEEQGSGASGGSIESIAPSPLDANLIWIGTNNGLVKVTRDHGKTWTDVTISGLPKPTRADISAIDASHFDQGEAYVAIDYHNMADFRPFFYRTRDFGASWTKITNGLPTNEPSGSFARVIRADTQRPALLFAGTESSVYVSFDDGDNWHSLALNLPNTSYRDMVVKGNDLVVGTYGRSFWVLDDISPLRQLSDTFAGKKGYLFKPAEAIRVRRNINEDTPFPPEIPHALNPPPGVILYYYLGQTPKSSITLEISDRSGRVVRHMSSDPIPPLYEPAPPIPNFWVEVPRSLPTTIGTNRINWDLRYDSIPATSHTYEINANPGLTPASPEGPLVGPGTYTATLTVDGTRYSQPIAVINDPRSPTTASQQRRQSVLQAELYDAVWFGWDGNHRVANLRKKIKETIGDKPAANLDKLASDLDSKLSDLMGALSYRGSRTVPKNPSFGSVYGGAKRLLGILDPGDMAPNEVVLRSYTVVSAEKKAVEKLWATVLGKDIPGLNQSLKKLGKPEIQP